MRPVELELAAFGPFPEREVVDFAGLAGHGLFVVCGPTGSGKSTLFDAMTYALYGIIPGERLDHIRSHHAATGATTAAALTFEVASGRYRVERTAKHERPRLRGAGVTTVTPTAALYRITAAGREPITAKIQEVNARCEQLVGLSAAQFQRVVLLPQGKWSAFLLADTRTRRELLQQLFGTELYERATELARQRVATLQARVAADAAAIERHRANAASSIVELATTLGAEPAPDADATVSELAAALASIEPALAAHTARAADAAEAAEAARRAHADAVASAAGWDRRRAARERLAALEVDTADMERLAERVAAARRAATVRAAASDRAAAATRAVAATTKLAEANERALAALAAAAPADAEGGDAGCRAVTIDGAAMHLATRRGEVAAQLEQTRELQRLVGECGELAQAAERAADQLAASRRALAGLERRRTAIDDQVRERLAIADTVGARTAEAEAAAGLLTARRELDELTARAEVVKAAADDAASTLDDLTSRFLADVAPELAARLTPGVPCPVCGSEEHPAPAASRRAGGVTRDEVDAARGRSERATRNLHEVLAEIESLRRRLGEHAARTVQQLEVAHRTTVAAQRVAAEAEADVLGLNIELAQIDKQLAEVAAQQPPLIEQLATSRAQLEARRSSADELRGRLTSTDAAALEGLLDRIGRAERQLARLGPLASAAAQADGALAQADTHLTATISANGFATLDGALAVALPDEELAQLAARHERWVVELAETRTRVRALDELDLPEERPDVERLTAAAAAAATAAETAAARERVLAIRRADATDALGEASTAAAAGVAARADYDTARAVFETCNGNNLTRVQLETWVLAGELDRVTAAANVHLARMTRHRYALRRDEPSGIGARRAGLDLVVDDADTGRPRPPSTLSGGEQFQASLALALGLADVVSQTGAVHEALFVDEGFGSLDSDALDEAVDALCSLQATGRLVGVITHVETMRRQLPVGIEVRRRTGGGSTLN